MSHAAYIYLALARAETSRSSQGERSNRVFILHTHILHVCIRGERFPRREPCTEENESVSDVTIGETVNFHVHLSWSGGSSPSTKKYRERGRRRRRRRRGPLYTYRVHACIRAECVALLCPTDRILRRDARIVPSSLSSFLLFFPPPPPAVCVCVSLRLSPPPLYIILAGRTAGLITSCCCCSSCLGIIFFRITRALHGAADLWFYGWPTAVSSSSSSSSRRKALTFGRARTNSIIYTQGREVREKSVGGKKAADSGPYLARQSPEIRPCTRARASSSFFPLFLSPPSLSLSLLGFLSSSDVFSPRSHSTCSAFTSERASSSRTIK